MWLSRELTTTESRRFHGKLTFPFFWISFSFDTFTCTFRSSDNEVCICTALKCPWVVLGFKVPGHQTRQAHQQRLLQSGIWQRKNGSYVSESLGAASWYCGNRPLFAFLLYCGYCYCSVCLPVYQCSDYCNFSSDRTVSGRFAAKFFSFVSVWLHHEMNALQKTLSRFKEIFFIEATVLFVLRKSFLFSRKPS